MHNNTDSKELFLPTVSLASFQVLFSDELILILTTTLSVDILLYSAGENGERE